MDDLQVVESGENKPLSLRSEKVPKGNREENCAAIPRGWRTVSFWNLIVREWAFEQLGFILARKPFNVFLAALIVLVACCFGFIRLHIEKPSENFFIAAESQSRQDVHDAAKFFPLLNTRKEELIILPQNHQNILSQECLNDAILIHKTIVNITGYKELCARQVKTFSQQNETCVISSPLELSGVNFENIKNLSSILLREWKTPRTILSTGQTFKSALKTILANFRSVITKDHAWADALQIIYFVRKPTTDQDHEKVLNFEKSIESVIGFNHQRLNCASVFIKTGRTKSDSLEYLFQFKLMPLYVSALIILVVLVTALYLLTSKLGCLAIVLLSLVNISVPLASAAGIVSMAGLPLLPTALFVPFLLLGKGTADLLIILMEWGRQEDVPSFQFRVGSCLSKGGLLTASSSVCGIILLGIAIKSSVLVISNFFICSILVFIFSSLTVTTLVVVLLIYGDKYPKTFSYAPQLCRGKFFTAMVDEKSKKNRIKQNLTKIANVSIQSTTSPVGKSISLLIFVVILVLCIVSAFKKGERIGQAESLYKNENYRNFNDARKKFFDKERDVSIIFFGKLNYSQEDVQRKMITVCETLGKASYSKEESACWITEFKKWVHRESVNCSGLEFYKCLKRFLTDGENILYQRDVLLDSLLRVSSSRVHLNMSRSNQFQDDKRSLNSLRKDLNKSPLQVVGVSEEFFRLDDIRLLEKETIHVLIFSAIVVFISCLLTSASIFVSGYLVVTFFLLIFETTAIMQGLEIQLNEISILVLFAVLVVSFTYSIQVSHAFILSEKLEVNVRMVHSLRHVGWSVLLAAFTTIIGSISLSFIFPNVNIVFTAVVPLITVLGLFHALILLPSHLSLLDQIFTSCDSQEVNNFVSISPEESLPLKFVNNVIKQFKAKKRGISIVGIGCRFPGANSKDLFWDLLVKGNSSIGEFPRKRVDVHKTFQKYYHPKRFVSGRLCATNGSYLEDIEGFDNVFFGISNQEARSMDPQQRILLQVVYEAIEDAGMRLEDLQKCRAGVFVGVMNLEYGSLITDSSNYKNIDQFSSTGMTASIIANRVSFSLNLTGPSVAVDTACSSSLTAFKIACDNLQNGDCEVAIVCASNVVLNHAMQMVSSMAGLLAPDGRCKSFDASGDGYGRGEGVAAVLLKLTEAAVSDKDDIYCEIVACSMNNDGQNAVPMTAPSAKMQAALSRRVLEQSGMSPEDIDYFEAHGTGTAIGDVVEVDSITDTYTSGTRQTRKLRIGSIKSNLNHTESTSGLAGLIKVALMIKQQMFVPTVNVHLLNPKLKLHEKGMVLQQTCETWTTAENKPRVGAVNSFGYGGSNVHAILCEVQPPQQVVVDEKSNSQNYVLTISARSKSALKQMAMVLANWLRDHVPDDDKALTANVCYSLNERRSQHPHRLALSFGASSDASQSLSTYANETVGWDKLVSYGEPSSYDQKVVFMFGGQGSQWYGMGRQLFEYEPVFKEAIWEVSNVITALGEKWSLADELMKSEQLSKISENWLAQPATFAVQYATAQLLKSWGICPTAVLGHSLGEFAAAAIAGIITVREAVQLVLIRSSLQEKCPRNGGMAALGMSERKAKALLSNLKLENTLEIAAVNDANSVTVSGDSESVQALGDHLKMNSSEVFWRVLGTKRAFHSFHMESIRKPFHDGMKRLCLKPQLGKIPMYSTVTGEVICGQQLDERYWWQNIRCHVQFYPATTYLLKDGYKQIIEISTQPILAHYVKQIGLQESLKEGESPVVLATLPRKRVAINDQHKMFLQNTVCKLHSLGYPIDWRRLQGDPSAKFIHLPTYPWKENIFWYREQPPQEMIQPLPTNKSLLENHNSTRGFSSESQSLAEELHPFLGKAMITKPFSGLHCWETEIDLHRIPWLKDHALAQGSIVMPGAAYLEMAFAMVKDTFFGMAGMELTDVKLSSLLTLPETQIRTLRLRLLRASKVNEAQFQVTSIQDDQSEIMLSNGNVSVDLLRRQSSKKPQNEAFNTVGPAVNDLIGDMERMPLERFREITERYGFNYGPNFCMIKQAWQRDNRGLSLVDLTEAWSIREEAEKYVIHPSILDACLQTCFVPLGAPMADDTSVVPVGFKTITVNDIPRTTQLFCYVAAEVSEFGVFDVTLLSPAGNVLLTMSKFRVAELTSLPRQVPFSELAYQVQWRESYEPLSRDPRPDLTCLILKDSSQFSNILVEKLQTAQVRVISVDLPTDGVCDSEAEKVIKAAFSDAFSPNVDRSNVKIVNLWPIETNALPSQFDIIEQTQRLAFKSTVFLSKLLIESECLNYQLLLVTLRTQMLKTCREHCDDITIPWCSTLWGFRRTANLEDLRVTAIDLNNINGDDDVNSLAYEILSESVEDEVAFRDGRRFINRVVRWQESEMECLTSYADKFNKEGPLCLANISFSTQLCVRKQSFSQPLSSEVQIKLLYCWTPSESIHDLSKPKGCVFVSGNVAAPPGEGISGFQIGETVCGIIPSGRVGGCINVKASQCFRKPALLTREQATFIPGCLAVASQALQRVVSGEISQKILINEANQGPGPAAVLLGAVLGHRVHCTVSETCSRAFKSLLLEMGADDVIYQECPQLDADWNNQFDAVLFLCQPSPNALQRSIRLLRKGGKLLILNSGFEGDLVFSAKKNLTYVGEDIADTLLSEDVYQQLSSTSLQLLESRGVIEKLLELKGHSVDIVTVMKALNRFDNENDKGHLQRKPSSCLSYTIYSLASLGSHLPPLEGITVLPRGLDDCGLKENRTYLVAGGIRGFGFEVAKWMADNGAKTIGLLGRSKPTDAARQEISELETKTGAKIHMFQVDISSKEQMVSFAKDVQSLPNVAGIVLTAMVLRDAEIKHLAFESFVEVMAPKIKGSFLLHQMSLNMDLDFFVMFSSMAAVIGNMGQASYSAANAFQDALAMYRRQVLGLPGLSINWGPISGAGVMLRETSVAKLLTKTGLGFIPAKEGAKHMEKVLKENPGCYQIALFDADWPRFLKSNKGLKRTPRLADIWTESETSESQATFTESLAQRIVLEKNEDKRAELVKEYISLSVAEWTAISSPSEMDLNKSLYSYGVDSTAALTLKMQLEANLQVSFEVFYFMQPDTTPLKVARDVTAKLNGQGSNSEPRNEQSQDDDMSQGDAQQSQLDSEKTIPANPMGSQAEVVPLFTPAGSVIKFFCVHPSHRYAMSLVPISTGFQGQDLVSFYALGFTDPTAVSEDWGGVRPLANHYVQLISKVQRHGPYFLGGYSYGGLLAYEMASILTELNQRVEFVAMIDTFPWSPRARYLATRLGSMHRLDNWQEHNVKLQFENYLRKLAVESLKIPTDEYETLNEERDQDWIIDELQRRSLEQNVAAYDLRALRESLLRDHDLATRTHNQWQPPEIRYRGPLTFLKSKEAGSFPRFHSVFSSENLWSELVDGGTTVLICPGDHYSMSELPYAHVTGSILATSLLFSYRILFPDFPRPLRTFSQRRAVEKYCSGVTVFLHSKKGNKRPHFGELHLEEERNRLVLRSKDDEDQTKQEKAKKTIDLKDLLMVQPGRFVSSSLKYASQVRRAGTHQSGNLGQTAGVVTNRRVYSLEFTDFSDLKDFYNMIEALFSITIVSS